ncbi:MAG TPA: hypothetical protein VLW46_00730 [Candidatus Bathyarchaeia archaeon]|nr:hypothetical protein [Candidatus Bathyarchaeia archaeon]
MILNFHVPNPITLNISIFVVKGTSQGPLQDYLDAAVQRLQHYGFALNIHPASRTPIEIAYVGKIGPKFGADDEDTECGKARGKAADAFNDQANPLRFPIIMAPINQADRGDEQRGITQVDYTMLGLDGRKTISGVTWLPFTIVDSDKKDADSGALFHEMCHGALLRHPGEGPDPDNVATSDLANIMRAPSQNGPARTVLNKKQVRALAKCYFATPRTTI